MNWHLLHIYIARMFEKAIHTPVVRIFDETAEEHGVELYIKREDLTHPYISGNKYRKLKYNLIAAREQGYDTLLTFGGAFSNHIHAVACAGREFGFKTLGVIRGERAEPLNPTLRNALDWGMKIHHISRTEYRRKGEETFIEDLKEGFGDFYLVPEGGSNAPAVKGCTEIIGNEERSFDYICCACGTGGTIAGIIAAMDGDKKILGFPAMKNGLFLMEDINRLIEDFNGKHYANWRLITDYHFGGFAKFKPELITFINDFKKKHGIQLEPVYTGKLLYGIIDMIKNGFFRKGEKILTIHTGGLQGIRGFNMRFGNILK